MNIKFTLLIMALSVFMLLTGCATQPERYEQGIVIKMANIERLKADCAECEKNLPGQCVFGKFSCGIFEHE